MKKPIPVAPTPGPDRALAGLNRARPAQSHRSPFLSTLGGRSVAVLAGNLIALSLLLSACQDSTAEVIMTPTPGASSSSQPGSSPSSEPGGSSSLPSSPGPSSNPGVTSNAPTPPSESPAPDQNQPNWRLTRWVQNNQPVSLLPEVPISLDWQQGRVSGSGGCNQFGAAYRLEGDRVIVDPLQSTRRACKGPIMEQEARFFAVLQQVRQVTLENNQQLTLTYGEEPTAGSLVFSPR